ncbi:hypothetical protein [Janthinobacterium sp. SUN206]|uniref:hypothetical protein n=1 Tax=Janthinobacterium sp. SUN206 TaxID=3014787 RepID=UPI002712EB3B|nr:hypothetical protein [Janthinobacterium sp. SUN206]MDO8065602.1 hypothetical protein [Janthinobacterium sp. SUN206]
MSVERDAIQSKRSTLRAALTFFVGLVVIGLLFLVYWSLHLQSGSTQTNEQQAASEEKYKAWYAVKYCREQAESLPAGSGEAQIARDACQQMQKQYEQTYRLTP